MVATVCSNGSSNETKALYQGANGNNSRPKVLNNGYNEVNEQTNY
jgi:hypothetical protein